MKATALILAITILLSGCTNSTNVEDGTETAKTACIELCNKALTEGNDLSNGPCLSDPDAIAGDWVCDVAHSPRQAIDNEKENHCSAFREGLAHHFVEVDERCKIIKVY